jgi:hypothetical protein
MNLKLRLERLCDNRSWARLHFNDGSAIIGRLLRLGHDYLEIECYGDSDQPGNRDYSKHLVPIHLIKFITIESSQFSDAERHRLKYLSQLESSQEWMPELEK